LLHPLEAMGQAATKASDGAQSFASKLVSMPVTSSSGIGSVHRDGPSSIMDFFPGSEVPKEVAPIEVSPLASTSHSPVGLAEATVRKVSGVSAAAEFRDMRTRDWEVNSVLEVLSVSKNRWYVGYVLQVHAGVYDSQLLTVRFWDEHNDAKQKNITRNDASLSHFGVHSVGQLPPGFKEQASQSRPGSSAFVDMATGMKYSSSEIAWNVHFQRLRDGPQPKTPDSDEDDTPVPRRSPAGIADGLADDVAPKPARASSSKHAAPAPASPVEDRWRQAQSQCIEQWAKHEQAEEEKFAKVDAKAKRNQNQPKRSCPGFSKDSVPAHTEPPPGRSMPPRSCPTFSPSHLDDVPQGSNADSPHHGHAKHAAPAKLLMDDLAIGAGGFDPTQLGVLDQLRRKLACSANRAVSIEETNDFRGGLNDGIWFLGDYVLKLVKSGRRHPACPSETETLLRLQKEHADVARDPSIAFPVAIFSCIGTNGDRKHELIVMRMARGTKLATLIALLWNANQHSKIWMILRRVGAYLANFQAKYGKTMCHGDFHPSNIFYDEASDAIVLIDLGTLGVANPESDADHFEKSLKILANNYGNSFEIEALRSFRTGYASSSTGACM